MEVKRRYALSHFFWNQVQTLGNEIGVGV